MQQGPADTALVAEPVSAHRRGAALEIGFTIGIGVLLIAAILAGFASLYREFWGPSAFVERYVQLIADGRAADALAVPGVSIDTVELERAGLSGFASDALLRSSTLGGDLGDIRAVSETTADDITEVTVEYAIGDETGSTTFRVAQAGSNGLVPVWRFASSPLGVLDVSVHGSMTFQVNGFELDKRQVSPDGLDADPAAAVPLLAFVPMSYDVSVDSATTAAEPHTALADTPLTAVKVDLVAEPTPEFLDVVDQQVASFLSEQCASQQVLQPAGCPFWVSVENRLASGSLPEWSIVQQPEITLVPEGPYWRIEQADGLAHIEMDVQSIATGAITHVSEDIPFTIDGTVEILADGSAQIRIGAPLLD